MNAGRDLTEAYQEWRRLAGTVGGAIGAGDWNLVSSCQKSLQHLQKRITRLSPAARKEWIESGGDPSVREKALKETIRDLIELQQRNQTLLREKKEATRLKLDQLRQAGRNLKQIQRSYVLSRPASWTSFS
jgi:hypothetical protein